MPLIRVELFDYRMNDETSAALIEKLTDALCEATHPGLKRPHVGDRRGAQPEELGSRRQAVARRRDAARSGVVRSSRPREEERTCLSSR